VEPILEEMIPQLDFRSMGFIADLEVAFQENSQSENALAMAKYMKNHFAFFGIKTTERRQLFKEVWKVNKEDVPKMQEKLQ